MRKEPFGVGDFIHVYNRGNKKLPIVRNERDKQHFLHMLYYFNTEITPPNPFRDITPLLRLNLIKFVWPSSWVPRTPIVKIISFVLMKNHFHFLLEELIEGGIAKFMQRLGTGMTMYHNRKYQETGSLFQGSYKAKVVDKDLYLKYLSVYIQVKNVFELYDGGFQEAMKNFDKAYQWAIEFPFGSLGYYYGKVAEPIIDKSFLLKLFNSAKDYKSFSEECMLELDNRLHELTIESVEV